MHVRSGAKNTTSKRYKEPQCILHCNLGLLMATSCCHIVASIVLSAVYLSSVAASNTSCPTWFFYSNATQQCQCGCKLDCDKNQALIKDGSCATSSGENGDYYVGFCPFGNRANKTNRIFSEMPSDPRMLDDFMCGPYNRKGLLCGECIDGYGPPAYSFDLKCVNCSKLSPTQAITLYLVLELFPITVMFICLAVFRFNITSGPLLGYVVLCQLYTVGLKENIFIYEYLLSHVSTPLRVLFQLSLSLSQIWTLQFLQPVIPPFCISEKLRSIDIQMLTLVSATYPILLVIITCTLMELHARNCKIVHSLWKPFGIILSKTNITAVTGDAVIHAFASIIFLSNAEVIYTICKVQIRTSVSRYDCSFLKYSLYFSPNSEWLGHKHIQLLLIALVPFLFLTVIPSVLLTIYPTRIYSRCVSRCLSARKRLAITAFAEALHQCYKDGLNGTRDYRALAGLIFITPFFFLITRIVIALCGLSTPIVGDVINSALFLFFFAYTQPCKQVIANLSLCLLAFQSLILPIGQHLWTHSLTTPTETLELVFIMTPITSHVLVFMWVVYTLTNRMKARFVCHFNPFKYKVVLNNIT